MGTGEGVGFGGGGLEMSPISDFFLIRSSRPYRSLLEKSRVKMSAAPARAAIRVARLLRVERI